MIPMHNFFYLLFPVIKFEGVWKFANGLHPFIIMRLEVSYCASVGTLGIPPMWRCGAGGAPFRGPPAPAPLLYLDYMSETVNRTRKYYVKKKSSVWYRRKNEGVRDTSLKKSKRQWASRRWRSSHCDIASTGWWRGVAVSWSHCIKALKANDRPLKPIWMLNPYRIVIWPF